LRTKDNADDGAERARKKEDMNGSTTIIIYIDFDRNTGLVMIFDRAATHRRS
jgi:hypothetical protein